MRSFIYNIYILSYHIISYHIISYHMISYCIVSYHIISYYIISYYIISYHIILYHNIVYIYIYMFCLNIQRSQTKSTPVIGSQQKSAQWPPPGLGPLMAGWLPQFPSGRWHIYLGVALK